VLSGLAGFLLSLVFMRGTSLDPIHRSFIALAATVLPIVLLELLVQHVHRNVSTGLTWSLRRGVSSGEGWAIERVLIKLLGLAVTLAAICAGYWLFPVYREPLYEPYWAALREATPWFVLAAIPYFFYVDRRIADPHDGYWHVGMAVLGHLDRVDGAVLRQYALGWLIKGYFLPLMFVYLTNTIGDLLNAGFLSGRQNFLSFYDFGWSLAFAIDLVFITAGYSLTLRLIDSHIRSAEPTLFGWAVALVCYEPFWTLTYGQYLAYDDQLYWGDWLSGAPALQVLWGSAILALLAIYVWASVTFGCRFSNLTHRGILTNGPYRWSKHPAYLSKNLVFWLVSIPFVSTGAFDETLRRCLLLLGLNAIYFLRARTEERHLSRDPIYVAYALWIEQHGLLRIIGRALPFLRYVAPAPQQRGEPAA
jgi:protein-S-isoprenylcysteine O-methyltransferase Ste14